MKPHRRKKYTRSDDKAITDYIRKYGKKSGDFSIKGNAIYKQMERDKVTSHSWQSMRDRYVKFLLGQTGKYEFRQLIACTAKGKSVPVLKFAANESTNGNKSNSVSVLTSAPNKTTNGNKYKRMEVGGIIVRKQSGKEQRRQECSKRRVKDESLKEKYLRMIKSIRSEEGLQKLKILMFRENMKKRMVQYAIGSKKILNTLHSVNGDLLEVDNVMKDGKMSGGLLPWDFKDNKILKYAKEEEMRELIKRRGMNAVTDRINYLV